MTIIRRIDADRDSFIGHLEVRRRAHLAAADAAQTRKDEWRWRGVAEGLWLAIEDIKAWTEVEAKETVRRYESKRKAEAEPKCPRCGGETDPAWECSEGYCPECCQATDVGG